MLRDEEAAGSNPVTPIQQTAPAIGWGFVESGLGSLRAEFVLRIIPELGAVLHQTTPIAVRLQTLLPPIFEVQGAPDLGAVHMGELHLELLFDRGNGWESAFEIVIHGRVGVSASIDVDGLRLASNGMPVMRIDLLDTPVVPLDEQRLESVVQMVLTPIVPSLITNLRVVPIPAQQTL